MTTAFPGGKDSLRRPGPTDNTSDPAFYLDEVLDDISDAIEAVEESVGFQPINAQTGTSYTAVASDTLKLVTLTNSSPIALSIPGSVFTAGQRIDFAVLGTGMVTVAGSAGATVNGTPSLVSRAQYSVFSVICLSPTSFLAVGDFA
jgi:hypothetical protein